MRTLKVEMELTISEADYQDMCGECGDWSLEGEIYGWLDDLGFEFKRLKVIEKVTA